MNNTVLSLRKDLKLSQEKFGEKLGITGAAVSRIESGERSLTEQMIKAICREFNVNEHWLRTGEGKIYNHTELGVLLGKLAADKNEFKKKFISFMIEQPDEYWDVIETMIKNYNKKLDNKK